MDDEARLERRLSDTVEPLPPANIDVTIQGTPYGGRKKSRGDRQGPERWSAAVREQTKDVPSVKRACRMRVTFLLPPDKFPEDLPLGSDLDNLLNRLFNALNDTIFREAPGKDSCVTSLYASKKAMHDADRAGARIEIWEA